MRTKGNLVALLSVCLLGLGSTAGAAEFGDKFAIHGYGNWAYGKTNGNSYVNGNENGSWDRLQFALGVAAEPTERFSVHAQAFWEVSEEGSESSMDFAFAEYSFSPALALVAGRVKQPFGIYTEIFDVGILAPFTHLPQGIYGPAGFVAEAYNGVGITGSLDVAAGLRLQYDLYGGGMETELAAPWAEGETEGEEMAEGGAEEVTNVEDMIGGRLQGGAHDGTYTVGVSAYTGAVDTESDGGVARDDRQSVIGAHAEVVLSGLTLRTEYAYQAAETYSANAAYAEASYLLTPHWRLAVRYDWTEVDPDDADEVDGDLLESTDAAVAVNYIVSPYCVVKVAYHAVDGNRFAADDEAGSPDAKTGLVTAGVSFSF